MAPDQSAPALYGVLDLEDGLESLNLQIARLVSGHHCKLYVAFQGGPCSAEQCATLGLVDALGVLFNYLSKTKPRLYTVPLLPWAGWTPERIASLEDLEEVADAWSPQGRGGSQEENSGTALVSSSGQVADNIALNKLSNLRPPQLPPLRHASLPLYPEDVSHNINGITSTYIITAEGRESAVAGTLCVDRDASGHPAQPRNSTLKYRRVAVGGTFDRFHSGHMLLLAATALVSSERSYAGITADALLISKAHKELLQSYDQRRESALSYMEIVHPDGLSVEGGALSDPKEPTQAESDPLMEAIVVSEETLPGAIKINQGRSAQAFRPLDVIVVPVIGHQPDGRKLSSTDLRAADAGLDST